MSDELQKSWNKMCHLTSNMLPLYPVKFEFVNLYNFTAFLFLLTCSMLM